MADATQSRTKGRTILRFVLGLGQMGGAVVSGTLLFTTGVSRQTIFATLATTCMTAISRILFGVADSRVY